MSGSSGLAHRNPPPLSLNVEIFPLGIENFPFPCPGQDQHRHDVNAGRSLYEVQKILGHTQVKTTQRYAHLAQETLLDATNAVAGILGEAMPIAKPVQALLPAA